jgi:hypothetical protein
LHHNLFRTDNGPRGTFGVDPLKKKKNLIRVLNLLGNGLIWDLLTTISLSAALPVQEKEKWVPFYRVIAPGAGAFVGRHNSVSC